MRESMESRDVRLRDPSVDAAPARSKSDAVRLLQCSWESISSKPLERKGATLFAVVEMMANGVRVD
jgi:hypothetical protein